MLNLKRRSTRLALGVALSLGAIASLAVDAPAGAQVGTAANNLIIGSGSSTAYYVMQGMDTLFNDSTGCYMTQPTGTTQTQEFQCAKNNEGTQVGYAYDENPRNDVSVQEPALGSSAGIQQLESQGPGSDGFSPANPSAPINYARSSRLPKSSDYPGLNFVGYAADGVSFLTFPTINGKATDSSGVKSITLADLTDIWNGTIKTWNKLPGASKSATNNICVYTANPVSGTTQTWATALGFSSTVTLNAYVDTNPKLKGCDVPKGLTYADSHTNPENNSVNIGRNGDAANAIFFYSYGKYQVACNFPKTPTVLCNGGLTNTKPYLGEIDGIAPNATTILCDTPACTVQFPVTRTIFNAYSDGSFPPSKNAEYGFPVATPATINYVSEIGFICKPQTSKNGIKIADPYTDVWYHTEIDNVISANGFIPYPLQTHEDIGSVPTPAVAVLKAAGDKIYSPYDPSVGAGTTANLSSKNDDPSGYCQVYSTDGNTAP